MISYYLKAERSVYSSLGWAVFSTIPSIFALSSGVYLLSFEVRPSLVSRPPRPAFVACSTKSGGKPGRIYHVMRAVADVTYCS